MAVSAFFIGIAAVTISGVILKKFKTFAGKPAPFVMELPAYHLPSARNVLRSTWDRGMDFVKRAATIVLLSSIVLWFLKGYGFAGGSFGAAAALSSFCMAAICASRSAMRCCTAALLALYSSTVSAPVR